MFEDFDLVVVKDAPNPVELIKGRSNMGKVMRVTRRM